MCAALCTLDTVISQYSKRGAHCINVLPCGLDRTGTLENALTKHSNCGIRFLGCLGHHVHIAVKVTRLQL